MMKLIRTTWAISVVITMVLYGCEPMKEVVHKGKVEGMVWFNPADKEVLQFRKGFVIQTKWDSTAQGLRKTERFFTYNMDTVNKVISFDNANYKYEYVDSLGWALKKSPTNTEPAVVFNSAHNFIQAEKALASLSKQVHITGHVEVLGTAQPAKARVIFERITGQEEDPFHYEAHTDGLDGSYSIMVPSGYKYRVKSEEANYLGESRIVNLYRDQFPESDQVAEWHEKALHVVALRKGVTVRLHSIFFEFDKSALLPDSYPELEGLANVMKINPKMVIEIAGHTDNIGTKSYNQWLSEKRANSVKTFLVTKGLEAIRIQTIGYGETHPITSNDDEQSGRNLNRRIELRIVEY